MPNDDDTQPSARIDPRAEPPEQPKTAQLPAVPEWAIELTKSVKQGFVDVNHTLDELKGSDRTLTAQMVEIDAEFKDMRTRQRSAEEDIRRLSMRTKDTNVATSKVDQEHEAKLAQALSALEAEKAKVAKLEETSATKADLKTVADAQTTDIVKSIEELAGRNKTVRYVLYAIAAFLLAAIPAATNLLTRPAPQTITNTVTK